MPKGKRKRIESLKPGDPMYGISRQDVAPGTQAHWRVLIGRHKISYGARFYDYEFGDELRSFAVASEFRDILLERIPPIRIKRSEADLVLLRTAADDLKQIELLLRELSKLQVRRDLPRIQSTGANSSRLQRRQQKAREHSAQLVKLTPKQIHRLKDRLNEIQHDQARYERVLNAIKELGIALSGVTE